METKRPFLPGSVNKLDHQLLKDSPVNWSTRIHLALFYGVAFSIFLTVICFIVPDDPRNYPDIYSWVILLGIISLLAFIFWMIYLLRFNVFKRFGKWGNTDTVKTFLLYFSIILLIVSWPFIPPIVQSIRANMAYSTSELVRDINSMNTKICQLEKDSIDTRFSKDTVQVKDSVEGSVMRVDSLDVDIDTRILNYYFIDTATLRERLAGADSVQKLNDLVYVFYECPNYGGIQSYSIENLSQVKLLRSIDLFRNVLQYKQNVDTNKVKNELASLFSKYNSNRGERWSMYYEHGSDLVDPGYGKRIRDKYDVHLINSSLNNIGDKKYRWDNSTIEIAWRTAYYIVLILALLVIIYRHTTRKTFFLSLLSAVVLTILTGLFLAASYSSENSFYTWIIVYCIIFSILSALISRSRQRNGVSGIALNLLVFITPFMPLVITASYYSSLRHRYIYGNELIPSDYLFVNEERNYFIAEIAGFILLLVLLATLYQMAYRKWYALPEQ